MRTWTQAALAALVVAGALGVRAPDAAAFCGFYVSGAEGALYNDATKVVLMREGTRTVLSMQNNYQGPPEDFAMVVPVPIVLQEENVKTLEHQVFADVDQMASPRLVEYWEQDPCAPTYYEDDLRLVPTSAEERVYMESETDEEEAVKIEAQFKVGEYEIVILSAKDSGALDKWLRQNKYNIPDGAEPALRPYIDQGMFFFVARVDLDKVKRVDGRALLSPLRFHYDSEKFTLPIRLGLLNARDQQDLIVHILARSQRYQVVGRENVTIPTNVGVADETRARFGEFYAALLDRTLEKNPSAVVTEYAWDAGSCDPCPGPTLQPEHFLTLGADALPGGATWGYVLTRLHMRYGKGTLKDDLVFAAAPPIVGGREFVVKEGELEEGAQPGDINNFQARYIIRHPWEGPIQCEAPVRGRWGGPPSGGSGVTPAGDTAFAPRGQLELARYVKTPIPALDLQASALKAVEDSEPLPPGPVVGPPPGSGGCASCSSVSEGPGAGLGWLAVGALGLLWALRGRRRG
jgi:MYXO-CTERM domain-containing protein